MELVSCSSRRCLYQNSYQDSDSPGFGMQKAYFWRGQWFVTEFGPDTTGAFFGADLADLADFAASF